MRYQVTEFDGVRLAPRRAGQSASARPFRRWLCGALVVLGLALSAWHPGEAARQRNMASRAKLSAAFVNFAIADFDGDSQPDFATVQPGPAMASRTNYWIHFELSLGNAQSFALSAPTGGLQIASRDVNGDSFLDLIVSTRISNQPVAVLLNDGRGRFRLADPAAFDASIWETRLRWGTETVRSSDRESALASAGWSGGICISGVHAELLPAIAKVFFSSEKPAYLVLSREFRGRAPPAA
ncbi:MAG: VCBS repeat-containing protein [Candidatus Acidiferrum sp.]